jgi:AraC-like DNA-binding protein
VIRAYSRSASAGGEVVVVVRFSTTSVAPAERLARWEAHNERALVGLTASTYAEEGLLATSVNADIDTVAVAGIRGNQHAIERTPALVRQQPKDAVFLSVLLSGEAFLYHPGGCTTIRAGEALVYETRRPYLFGFPTPMAQVMLDVPREVFAQRCCPAGVPTPVVLVHGDGRSAAASALATTVRRALHDGAGDADHLVELLGRAIGPGGSGSAHLAAAREHIRRHLADRELSVDSVAAAVGVSSRHLRRLFAAEGTTVAAHLREQRLEAAAAELRRSTTARIADVAARWAFSSQAHFAHAVKERYGTTPSQLRADGRAATASTATPSLSR